MANIWKNTSKTSKDITDLEVRINTLQKEGRTSAVLEGSTDMAYSTAGRRGDTIFPQGNIYLLLPLGSVSTAVTGYTVVIIDPTTGYVADSDYITIAATADVTELTTPTPDYFHGRIAADDLGNVYILSGDRIFKFDDTGTLIIDISARGDDGLTMFEWADGYLWFNDGSLLLRQPDDLTSPEEGVYLSETAGGNGAKLSGRLVLNFTDGEALGATLEDGDPPWFDDQNFGFNGWDTLLFQVQGGTPPDLDDAPLRNWGIMSYSKIHAAPFEHQSVVPTPAFTNLRFNGHYLYASTGAFISFVIPEPFNGISRSILVNKATTESRSGEFIMLGTYIDAEDIDIPTGTDTPYRTKIQRFNVVTGDFIDYLPELSPITEWNGYISGTPPISIGTMPTDTALNDVESEISIEIILQMRAAIDDLAPRFRPSVTEELFDTTNGSENNLYNIALGDRSEYGFIPEDAQYYTYTRSEAAMISDPSTYDIDIGEIYEQILILEASQPG